MRRALVVLVGVAAVITAGAWMFFSTPAGTASPAAAAGFSLTDDDRTMGNSKAPLVLIEYAAPVCPHCAAFEMENFPTLKTDYIDRGKVFYVFRVYPIRPEDGPTEKLARCMPREKYFAFIDLLFHHQPEWDSAEYPVADGHAGLIKMARIAGMAPDEAERCMQDARMDDPINRVAQEGERRYGISGTPTFILNGVSGPAGEPWGQLRKRLDAALTRR